MGDTPKPWTHEEIIARHERWIRELYLQRPEPDAVRCETVGGGGRERCPEAAAYTVRASDNTDDDHDICERCLPAWIHNATAFGWPVLVRRYRAAPPPETF